MTDDDDDEYEFYPFWQPRGYFTYNGIEYVYVCKKKKI